MTHVIRRRAPRHDGTRYYSDRGPCARETNDGATYETAEAAETQRAKLREPHLWEVLPKRDAALLDYNERRAAASAPANPVLFADARRLALLWSLAERGMKL